MGDNDIELEVGAEIKPFGSKGKSIAERKKQFLDKAIKVKK